MAGHLGPEAVVCAQVPVVRVQLTAPAHDVEKSPALAVTQLRVARTPLQNYIWNAMYIGET